VTFASRNGVQPFAPAATAASRPAVASWTRVVAIEPNYFDVFDTPVRAGRPFDVVDATDETRRVAVVNEAFVRTVLASFHRSGSASIRSMAGAAGRPANRSRSSA
jgi:hypothetical protein